MLIPSFCFFFFSLQNCSPAKLGLPFLLLVPQLTTQDTVTPAQPTGDATPDSVTRAHVSTRPVPGRGRVINITPGRITATPPHSMIDLAQDVAIQACNTTILAQAMSILARNMTNPAQDMTVPAQDTTIPVPDPTIPARGTARIVIPVVSTNPAPET